MKSVYLKRLVRIGSIILLFLGYLVYSAERVVLCENFTNAYCTNCPLVGTVVDGYLEEYPGEVSVLRFHTSFDTRDPYYFPELCDWATNAYGVSGIPQLFLDGEQLPLDLLEMEEAIDAYFGLSPVEFDVSGSFDEQTRAGSVDVNFEIIETLENGVYKIFLYLTEDELVYDGSNGENIHNQVVRAVFPSTDGIEIDDFEFGAVGGKNILFDIPEEILLENCNLITVFQDRVTKSVQNSAQIRLSELSTPTGIEMVHQMYDYQTLSNFPNPFNPTTVISYHLPISSVVQLMIFDLHGKMIDVLVETVQKRGMYEVEWVPSKGVGTAKNVPSGVYFASLKTKHGNSVHKILYMK